MQTSATYGAAEYYAMHYTANNCIYGDAIPSALPTPHLKDDLEDFGTSFPSLRRERNHRRIAK